MDIAPGTAPATARFSDYGEMQGRAFLSLTELLDPDSDLIEISFQPESAADDGMHSFANPISIPPNQLGAFVSGEAIALSDADPIAYGALSLSDSPDYSTLIHRRPTSIRLTQHDGAHVALVVALGPLLDARNQPTTDVSTSVLSIEGLLSVSCRPADGQDDPHFDSPFCASLLTSANELADIAEL